jgi:hypothetical protein
VSHHTHSLQWRLLLGSLVPSQMLFATAELMVTMPLAMVQAVSQHSNVIRRAAWTHYGFVVGQEGDSFILAFRDACDAVAFCLQVRTGLRHGVTVCPDYVCWIGQLGLNCTTVSPRPIIQAWCIRLEQAACLQIS